MNNEKIILKKIESAEEFHIKEKEYKKRINKHFRKAHKYLGHWEDFGKEFLKILEEGVFIGLYQESFPARQMARLEQSMNKTFAFLRDGGEKRDRLQKKIRQSKVVKYIKKEL